MNLTNKIFSLMVQIPAEDGDKGGGTPGISGYVTEQSPPPTTSPANAQGTGSNNSPPPVPPATSGTPNATATSPTTNGNSASGETTQEDVTGYSTPPPPTTPPVAPTVPSTKLELDLKGLDEDSVAVKYVRAKAESLGLNKEQAQKLLDSEKLDTDNHVKAQQKAQADYEANRQNTFKAWEKELRDDPDFGGEKFAQNVHQVNKMINEHFPSIKKQLTDTKSRLEPKYMRELANVAKKLYAEGNIVNGGDGSGQPQKHSPLDFYEQKKT